MKGTDFTACTPSKSINPFAEGRTACAAKLTYVNCVEEGSMASIRDNHPPCILFPARFLLLLAQLLTEHERYALGVIAGDEGMYRRYEADF